MGNVNQYVALGEEGLFLKGVGDAVVFGTCNYECGHAHDGTQLCELCRTRTLPVNQPGNPQIALLGLLPCQ
nr:hypothetical protein CE91St29_24590 [Corynebacterium striatum]